MIQNYQFSKFIKSFFLSGFANSFNDNSSVIWSRYTNYVVGDIVQHTYITNFESTTNRYIAISGYKSGNNPPIHTNKGEIKSDGGVRWLYIDTLPNTNDSMNNLYITFGRSREWNNTDMPPNADITPELTPESISDIIYAKKVDKKFISIVANRNSWEKNKVYSEYHASKVDYDKPHYTTNKQGMIYYCLYNNNNSISVIEPLGESSEPINTTDGYIWLYVGKVNLNTNRFISDEYIPINKDIIFNPHLDSHRFGIAAIDLTTQQVGNFDDTDDIIVELQNVGDGTGASFNVVKNVAGVIEKVEIVSSGQKYNINTKAIIKNVISNGTGATATATINDGEIEEITITNVGSDYKNAVIVIDGDGTGATAQATISSVGTISDITITDSGSGYTYANIYIVAGNSAKVCDVRLLPYNVNKIDLMASFNNASIMFLIEINPSNDYFPYGTYYRECMFVVDLFEKDNVNMADKNEYIGKAHIKWDDEQSKLRKIDDKNGFVLYRQTTEKVLHIDSQSEVLRLIISL